MNILRRLAVILQHGTLELLLVFAVITLIGQFSWPAVVSWWRRPIPGTVGIDRFDPRGTLATGFLIYVPDDDVGDGTWPLIVFLHGSGQRGNDPNKLRDWGPFRYLKRSSLLAIVAAPQCLPKRQWEPQAVVQFVEHLSSRYHVDRQRIYLVGCSMGGYGTWRTAAAHPAMFAAIVPICGGGDPKDGETLAGVPTWAFHGAKDELVPVAESKQMVDALHAAGGSPRLTVLPSAGHSICHSVCERTDLWQWLLRQRLELR